MSIFLYVAAVAAFVLGAIALKSMQSDIQLIIAAVCFTAGIIMIGLAYLIELVRSLNDRLQALEISVERKSPTNETQPTLQVAPHVKPMRWPDP